MSPSQERRRSKRLRILQSFSLFVVVPKKGAHRLKLIDLSKVGIGFEFDEEGEDQSSYPLVLGEKVEVALFLNQSLSLALTVEIRRIQKTEQTRQLGAEFTEKQSKNFTALSVFVDMLDLLAEAGELTQTKPSSGGI